MRRGKLNLLALPPGRFLYQIHGTGPICEGRILDRQPDPDGEGEWLKLDESGLWHWSGDVWIEHLFPEPKPAMAVLPAKPAIAPAPKLKSKPLSPDS